jgi:hypothetical protein
LGIYRKNIANYQVSDQSELVTADDITKQQARFEDGTVIALNPDWDISTQHIGYDVSTMYNLGSARLDGAEFEVRQSLDPFVPQWARGFTVRGTSAYNNLRGRPGGGDLSGVRDWRNTAGINYRRSRFSVNVNYQMNGQQINSVISSNGIDGIQVTLPQRMLDFNVEVRITKWLNFFVQGRNILDELRARENQYKESPAFTYLNSSNTFGVTYAVGVTGSFGDVPIRLPWDKRNR